MAHPPLEITYTINHRKISSKDLFRDHQSFCDENREIKDLKKNFSLSKIDCICMPPPLFKNPPYAIECLSSIFQSLI